MNEKELRTLLCSLTAVVMFQEIRFWVFAKKQKQMNTLFANWIEVDYQESIDEKFVEIAENFDDDFPLD